MKDSDQYDVVKRKKGNNRLDKRLKTIKNFILAFPRYEIDEEFEKNMSTVVESLKSLDKELGKFKPDEEISVGNMKKLQKLYRDTITAIDNLSSVLHEDLELSTGYNAYQDKIHEEIIKKNDMLANQLSKDLHAFDKNILAQNPISLNDIYESSRVNASYKVKKSEGKRTVSSGVLNERIPVTIVGEDNKETEGFFTKDSIFKPESEVVRAANKARKKYGKDADFIKDSMILSIYNSMISEDREKKDKYAINMLLKNPHQLMAMGYDKGIKFLDERSSKNLKKLLNTPKKFNIFIDVASAAFPMINKWNVNEGTGISKDSRMNRRNAAMSKVADFLGCPDILAKSENVLLNIDGTNFKGTFMKKAVGEDRSRLNADSSFFKANELVADKLSLKKSIADLQVIDYICGNVDRHSGNMLYNFKKNDDGTVELESVQGIDNDTCFGSTDYNEVGMSEIKPENMKVMTRSMYDRLMTISPAEFKQMLYGFDLTSKEIGNAEKRLQSLKKKVLTDAAEYKKGYAKGYLIDKKIKVVDDEELDMIDMRYQLANAGGTKEKMSTFDRVADNCKAKEMVETYNMDIDDEYVKISRDVIMGGIGGYTTIVDKLKSDTRILGGGSPGYSKMLDEMEKLRNDILNFNGPINRHDIKKDEKYTKEVTELKEKIRNALIATNEYIYYKESKKKGEEWRKETKPHKAGRTERRYKNALEVRKFLNDQLDKFDELEKVNLSCKEKYKDIKKLRMTTDAHQKIDLDHFRNYAIKNADLDEKNFVSRTKYFLDNY
ncbi:MAG: hypothetical protein K6G11_06635, partial [Lachnospiraceae bacterium]|nr:hypothetical protein [Lachnospiraceae bacterium]